MQQRNGFSFDEQLRFSQGPNAANIAQILRDWIAGAQNVNQACRENDKNGVDYWVELLNGKHLAVDTKIRKTDYLRLKGEDDLALETFSVVAQKKIGWTRDERKLCDYILWYWLDTGRWSLLPFLPLCKAMQGKWQEWRVAYRTEKQTTYDKGSKYESECVFVPQTEVWREMWRLFSGRPTPDMPGPEGGSWVTTGKSDKAVEQQHLSFDAAIEAEIRAITGYRMTPSNPQRIIPRQAIARVPAMSVSSIRRYRIRKIA